MAEKYNDIMNRVELSDEARQRILGNARKAASEEAKRGKVVQFPQWKRYAAVAACAAVVLLGAVALQNPRVTVTPDDTQDGVTVANGIVEVSSAQELSDLLGLSVPELTDLPFPVTETAYASYWGELAQISYLGEEQCVTLRVKAGNEDVSGDYNTYGEVNTVSVNGCEVTLKGNGGMASTAIWANGGYSYAVSADVPVSTDAMTALITQVT